MALWIEQTLKLKPGQEIYLGEEGVVISGPEEDGSGGERESSVAFAPNTRDEANRAAIALKVAARRLEEIGKGLE